LAQNLGDFLREEIQERNISVWAFASIVDVSHTTIRKFLEAEGNEAGYPSVEFLIKLAIATNKDIRYLITLVAPPETIRSEEIGPEMVELSRRIAKLSPTYRKIIDVIVATGISDSQ
jgi:transcriptional regulator with XRE-family HTH domain